MNRNYPIERIEVPWDVFVSHAGSYWVRRGLERAGSWQVLMNAESLKDFGFGDSGRNNVLFLLAKARVPIPFRWYKATGSWGRSKFKDLGGIVRDEFADHLTLDHQSPDQPSPSPNAHRPVWDQVIEDMRGRDAVGRARYGTPLQANNGRDALRDAYEEALDLAAYLKQALIERGPDIEAVAPVEDMDVPSPCTCNWLESPEFAEGGGTAMRDKESGA